MLLLGEGRKIDFSPSFYVWGTLIAITFAWLLGSISDDIREIKRDQHALFMEGCK